MNFLNQTSTFWFFCNKLYCLDSHTVHRWRCSKLLYFNHCQDHVGYKQHIIGNYNFSKLKHHGLFHPVYRSKICSTAELLLTYVFLPPTKNRIGRPLLFSEDWVEIQSSKISLKLQPNLQSNLKDSTLLWNRTESTVQLPQHLQHPPPIKVDGPKPCIYIQDL
jgi:hypothetical protein